LHHLAELAGTAQVQAMISTDKESLFFGDMRHFTPQSCSFLDFLSASDSLVSPGTPPETVHPAQSLHDCQAYLAQASLDPRHPLAALRQDFDLPQLISHVDVTHTNLWMSIRYFHHPFGLQVYTGHKLLECTRLPYMLAKTIACKRQEMLDGAGARGQACIMTRITTCCAWCKARRL